MIEHNMTASYILHHSACDVCVYSENGFYNPVCCHCIYVTFGKRNEPSFMTREMAEALQIEKREKDND